MARLVVLTLLAGIACGCKSAPATFDPFLGQQTIAPPATGQIGQAPPFNGAPPSTISPTTTAPGASTMPNRYPLRQQPGGARLGRNSNASGEDESEFGYTPDRLYGEQDRDVELAADEAADPEATLEAVGKATRMPPRDESIAAAEWDAEDEEQIEIKIEEPSPRAVAERQVRGGRSGSTRSRDGEPARFEPDGPVTEISDLPQRGAGGSPNIARTGVAGRARTKAQEISTGGVRAASFNDRPADATNGAMVSSGTAEYGYAPDYTWLKGKLEYSAFDRRWKLRYIPIDGQTDSYGGSVVLPDSTLLDAHRPGDFVSIEGTLGGTQPVDQGFAPQYVARRINQVP